MFYIVKEVPCKSITGKNFKLICKALNNPNLLVVYAVTYKLSTKFSLPNIYYRTDSMNWGPRDNLVESTMEDLRGFSQTWLDLFLAAGMTRRIHSHPIEYGRMFLYSGSSPASFCKVSVKKGRL